MSDWNPNLYLKFDRERTQPAIDLTMKIMMDQPRRIIDIGCGPGNSTNVLMTRWPQAEIIGLDRSQAMIAEAKTKYPAVKWVRADASSDLTGLGRFDIVFSNAAIQWMPDHERLLPNLANMLNANGILAVQVPITDRMPIRIELDKLASSDKWKDHFLALHTQLSMHEPRFYYDIICRLSNEVDLWETQYFHIMNSHADIVKWYSSTGLRPYLDCLENDILRTGFKTDFENSLRLVYPIQADGRILFPFTRIFFTVRKR
ncbi:MAG: methyltransferase domain-containing protein [Desulfobulbaceae bacterium]|jgi:trans-aconitate 2-methyltransferase|nr:methyltransferase domain-containing protein [Desulfobulbaceae bacterium]